MTTKTMYPNPNRLNVTANGRTYTGVATVNYSGIPLCDALILEANGWTMVPDGTGIASLPPASTTVLGGVKTDGTTITADVNGVISSLGGGGSSGVVKQVVTGLLNGSNVTYNIPVAANVSTTLVISNRGVLQVTLDGSGDFTLDGTGKIYTNNGTALTDVAHGGTDTLDIFA